MNLLKYIISTITFCLISSCTSGQIQKMSAEAIWKLGWGINENLVYKNYEIAELKFDSLLSLDRDMEINYLEFGLEAKSKLGKTKEVINILNNQSVEMLNQICQNQFAAELKPCENISLEIVENKKLQIELIKMYINDQYVRLGSSDGLLEKYNLIESEVIINKFGIDSLGIETDEYNRTRLIDIIDEYGFPTKALIGKDGMEGVFFIIQHSDDKEWQKSQLINIENSVKSGDMDGDDYAYLYDRIKTTNQEKQLYGTQFLKVDPINKTVQLFDTEDVANVDKRRMKMGLMPIEMYKRIMIKMSSRF